MSDHAFDPTLKIPKPAPVRTYSLFLPVLLIILTLDLNSARDCVSLLRHRSIIRASNAQASQLLQITRQKEAFVEKFQENLKKLAETDPDAARLKAELFPAPVPLPNADQPPK